MVVERWDGVAGVKVYLIEARHDRLVVDGPKTSDRRSHRCRRLAAAERGEGLPRLFLYAPDDLRSLGLELGRVALVRFFLAVF